MNISLQKRTRVSILMLLLSLSIEFLYAKSSIELENNNITFECDYLDEFYTTFGCPPVEDYKRSPAQILITPLQEGEGCMITCKIEKWHYNKDGVIFDKSNITNVLKFPVNKTLIDIRNDGLSLTNETDQTFDISLDLEEGDVLNILTVYGIDYYDYAEFDLWIENGNPEEIFNRLVQLISRPFTVNR